MQTSTMAGFTANQLTIARANDYVRALALAHGLNSSLETAIGRFLEYNPRTINRDLFEKAAVNPGTTLEPGWSAPLAAVRPLMDAFLELARPATLLGKLASAAVPFNVSVPTQSAGGTFRWVGQGAPTPVGNMQLASTTLSVAKAAGILAVTKELVRAGTPATVNYLRRELIRGMAAYLDQQLTDPSVTAVIGQSPASITNGAPSIGSAGTSAANAVTDIKLLISTFIAQHPDADGMTLMMSPAIAVALAVATNAQTLGAKGGTLFGVTVITSAVLGGRVIVLDPSALMVADDGGLDIDISENASVEMDTSTTSPPAAGTVLVSLWQQNLVGFKCVRTVNWKMARPSAVLYTNVSYV